MVVMDLTTAGRALAAFPATVLVGFAFGALGMALSTFMRSWQDFDLMASVQFALFLFSGTFVPAAGYPAALRWLVEVTPLYRVGRPDPRHQHRRGRLDPGCSTCCTCSSCSALGLTVAGRRMGKLLCR